MKRRLRGCGGQTFVEYALILAAMVVLAGGFSRLMGGNGTKGVKGANQALGQVRGTGHSGSGGPTGSVNMPSRDTKAEIGKDQKS